MIRKSHSTVALVRHTNAHRKPTESVTALSVDHETRAKASEALATCWYQMYTQYTQTNG